MGRTLLTTYYGSLGSPTGAAAARELGVEGGEGTAPEPLERREPGVGLPYAARIDGIQSPSAVRAHRRERLLSQDAQVLRNGRLGDAELILDDRAELAGGSLAVREDLENAPAYRISEDIERVHDLSIQPRLI